MGLAHSCTHDDDVTPVCTSQLLEDLGMVHYEGQYLDCKLYLRMYEYQDELYFLVDNECADMTGNMLGCDSVVIQCDVVDFEKCAAIRAGFTGIVGIQE